MCSLLGSQALLLTSVFSVRFLEVLSHLCGSAVAFTVFQVNGIPEERKVAEALNL